MEFLPSSSDLTTPKAAIVQTSLVVVVLTAIGLRFWLRRTYLPLNQPPLRAEEFVMTSKDFGDQDETRRDVSRAYVGGGIHLQLPRDADGDSFTVKLTPPPGSGSGVDKEAVKANLEAFIADLRAQLPEHQITDASVARILPMLTVNPAISALAAAGKPPMLKGNRFILRAAGGGDIAATLQALMVGYVAQLPGPDGKPSGGEEVLTVASPDLLAPPPDDDALKYKLSFALRHAQKKSLDEECTLPCVLDVPL